MSVTVPAPLSTYFAAKNAFDIDGMLACFADTAVVRDEGENRTGLSSIRGWMEETTSKYRVSVVPLSVSDAGEDTVVTAKVSGTFPGSPVELTYRFGIVSDKIARLSIG